MDEAREANILSAENEHFTSDTAEEGEHREEDDIFGDEASSTIMSSEAGQKVKRKRIRKKRVSPVVFAENTQVSPSWLPKPECAA